MINMSTSSGSAVRGILNFARTAVTVPPKWHLNAVTSRCSWSSSPSRRFQATPRRWGKVG